MVCTHLKYYTSDVHFTIYASYEKKRLKELMHPKRKDLLFFLKKIAKHFFGLKIYFDMRFDNLI
jgi:hypothetical protein